METEEERQARRRARLEEMKREKHRRELWYKWGVPVVAGLAVVIGIGLGFGAAALSHKGGGREDLLQGSLSGGQEAGRPGGDSAHSPEGDGAKSEASDAADRRKSRHAAGGDVTVAGRVFSLRQRFPAQEPAQEESPLSVQEAEPVPTPEPLGGGILPQDAAFQMTDGTEAFSDTILSEYGIFIDAETDEVLAEKEAYTRMNPASMTKMLTVLVAAEHLTQEDLEKTAPITIDITDYSYVNDCSNTGYALDEEVTVRDMFYGTILPSGADSALALAIYVAGSHEAFVDMMNEKLVQMGLGETSHFTNCVGVYDEEHYSTAYDMAVILKATVDNPFCREVMSAHTYTTSLTEQHPEGLLISNWFLRRIEDRDTHGEVLCAKTGYVDQSGSCAASLGLDSTGREYLCVTAGSTSTWTCIADQVELYQKFLPAAESAGGEAP